MGFLADYLKENTPSDLTIDWMANKELSFRRRLVRTLSHARIVKLQVEQAQLFKEIPRVIGQDYKLLRSPFDHLYLEFLNGDFRIDEIQTQTETDHVRAQKIPRHARVQAVLISIESIPKEFVDAENSSEESLIAARLKAIYFVSIVFFIPVIIDRYNSYVSSFMVLDDGRLYEPDLDLDANTDVVDRKFSTNMVTWTIHILNFLTSPSVIMEGKEAPEALQKARAKRGKEPLPGWYEITYKQQRYAPKEEPEHTGFHQHFRYDVRGYYAHFTKGLLAGRVIWIPPHQRGLRNTLYKPKSYRTARTELPAIEEIYQG